MLFRQHYAQHAYHGGAYADAADKYDEEELLTGGFRGGGYYTGGVPLRPAPQPRGAGLGGYYGERQRSGSYGVAAPQGGYGPGGAFY